MKYDFRKIEKKWQNFWSKNKTFEAKNFSKKPYFAVLGLNPHAGENGKIGNEELKVIKPAIRELKKKNRDLYLFHGKIIFDEVNLIMIHFPRLI